MRVLISGWFSFPDGEATAGDVLAAEAVARALEGAGGGAVPYDTAWSPGFRPGGLHLDAADPAAYSHVVFACGPVHSHPPPGPAGRDRSGGPLAALHRRFAGCRRIAVGVSVLDWDDPAVTAFDTVLARDAPGGRPVPDLSLAAPRPDRLPLLGVILTEGQHEYGQRRRHREVGAALGRWLGGLDAARLPLDTRLDSRDWRLPGTPAQLDAVLRRMDAVVTTRLHGLVLALRSGVPALAVDPVEGGGKLTAQARALHWPAALPSGAAADRAELDRRLAWCLSPAGRARAARPLPAPDLPSRLLAALGR